MYMKLIRHIERADSSIATDSYSEKEINRHIAVKVQRVQCGQVLGVQTRFAGAHGESK